MTHKTITNDDWPDLSGWHPLPVGGTIPEGMRYARIYDTGGLGVAIAGSAWCPPDGRHYRYRTERPVPVPLPTEEGTRIFTPSATRGLAFDLVLRNGEWHDTAGNTYHKSTLTRWAYAPEWNSTR